MSDPLSELVQLLRPRAVFSNVVSGRGAWAVRYSPFGRPSFCIMLEGSCRLAVEGHEALAIQAGDFILLPATPAFTISSFEAAAPVQRDPNQIAGARGELRYGEQGGEAEMRSLGGAFEFEASEPQLLVSLLPALVHVRGSTRLAQIVGMVGEESDRQQPGSEFMLSRLAELLLIEAMRASAQADAPPGLLRGLGDERLAAAIKLMHTRLDQDWTVEQLARAAALSRSSFYERFTRVVGVAPMTYLLQWRMAVARHLLVYEQLRIAEVAERVGYGSASAFSVAFRRQMGVSPRGLGVDR